MALSSRRKIGTRVLLGFLAVIAFVGVLGYLGIFLSRNIYRNLEEIHTVRLPALDYILEIDRDLQQLLVAERSMIFAKTDSEVFRKLLEDYETNLRQSEERWEKYRALPKHPEEEQLAAEYERARAEWVGLSRQVVEGRKADTREGRTLAIDLTLGQAKEKFEEMRHFLDQLTEVNLRLAEEDRKEARSSFQRNQRFALLLIVLAIIVSLMLSLVTTRSITRPLQALVHLARLGQEGDLTASCNLSSQDELGVLGQAFMGMIASLRTTVQRVIHAAERRARTPGPHRTSKTASSWLISYGFSASRTGSAFWIVPQKASLILPGKACSTQEINHVAIPLQDTRLPSPVTQKDSS